MARQVGKLGLDAFRFVDAVDGRTVPMREFAAKGLYDDAMARRYEGRPVSGTNVALCLSHFAVWELVVREAWPVALVLEDDAVFQGAALDCVEMGLLPEGWDVCLLDAYLRHKPPRGHVRRNIFTMESYRGGTAGYLLSAQGARKLLRIATVPVCHPVDGYMTWYNRHRLEGCPPWSELSLEPLESFLVYPRPVLNGSLAGHWGTCVGTGNCPDYL